jgi:hypothetical protein
MLSLILALLAYFGICRWLRHSEKMLKLFKDLSWTPAWRVFQPKQHGL